jgi:DNA repair exonuclease SbcCD nuclease subunit
MHRGAAYAFRVSAQTIRVLLIADTHLGFDLPQRPRVERHRRGEDFFDAYELALQPALRGDVDLVVHGGDILFRSRVKPGLVLRVFEPLKRIATAGVPVVVVPGNHERSAIPYPLLAAHPCVYIFDRPRTFALNIRGVDIAVAGFPCERNGVRDRFDALVELTGWRSEPGAIRLLCFHQSVERATVGPVNYMFRDGPDVIPGRAIPRGFAAMLAGHIHRHQVLTTDRFGRPIAAPVFYPGSTQRTSDAERGETKGYVTLEFEPSADGGSVRDWTFHPLPEKNSPAVSIQLPPVRHLHEKDINS